MPYVTFQQTVFRQTVLTIPEEQRAALEEYINTHLQEETDRRERPWRALKVEDGQLDIDLEREYVKQ